MLEWEIVKQPRGLKLVERAASPVLGKSYIVYATKVAQEVAEKAVGDAAAA